MSAEQYDTTERSSQDKKSEWEESLVGHHQHAYLLQQNLQQTPHAYTQHHNHLASGFLEGGTFRPSGVQPPFANLNPTIDGCTMQSLQYVIAGQGAVPSHRDESDRVSISHIRFSMPPLHKSSCNNHKGSANIPGRSHQVRGGELEHTQSGKTGGTLSTSTTAKSSAPRRVRNSSVSPLTVRPTGTKDRHSKVRTAKGLRDRRVRLSAPTAIQFFDVQDRLGYDQPSKAVDWLIKNARAAIDELAPVEGVIVGDEVADTPVHEQKRSKDNELHGSFVKVKDEEQSLAAAAGGGARAESRAKARNRARERAKEKNTMPVDSASTTPMETSSSPVAPTPAQSFTSTNLHLYPEFFMLTSQIRQQFDELHRSSDLSSMLTLPNSAPQPATHLPPFASSFFPTNSTIFSGDGPPIPYSAQPINYSTTTAVATTNNHNTSNSPRGTLQSIFSSPATSSMQAHVAMPSLIMMGGPIQAEAYGATTQLSSIVSESGHNNISAFRQSSVEIRSPNPHEHSRIPMRIRGMEQLGPYVEETRITPSSMQAEFQ